MSLQDSTIPKGRPPSSWNDHTEAHSYFERNGQVNEWLDLVRLWIFVIWPRKTLDHVELTESYGHLGNPLFDGKKAPRCSRRTRGLTHLEICYDLYENRDSCHIQKKARSYFKFLTSKFIKLMWRWNYWNRSRIFSILRKKCFSLNF